MLSQKLHVGRVKNQCFLGFPDLGKIRVYQSMRFDTGYFWEVHDLCDLLYEHKKVQVKVQHLDDVWSSIDETHRSLWPGVPVPAPGLIGIKRQTTVVTTSVFFSFVVWAVSGVKRNPPQRERAAKILRELLKRACNDKIQLTFPVFTADGTLLETRTQTMDDTLIVNPWSNTMSQSVAMQWDMDFHNDACCYPTTSRTSTSLVDFVIWALFPEGGRTRDHYMSDHKALLRTTALTMVTYVAVHYEKHILRYIFERDSRFGRGSNSSSDSDEFQDIHKQYHKKRKRARAEETNDLAARAAKLLYTGKDSHQLNLISVINSFWAFVF